jgi:TM2 domain-containing membrane protein YozV
MNPTESKPAGYCRTCGAPVHEPLKTRNGIIYCEEHFPMTPTNPAGPEAESPYAAAYAPARPVNSDVSPGLAFVLGMIPGVGAIYNGQYGKGLVHVVILGLLITMADSGAAAGMGPLIFLMTAGFFFYMAFEAYHTAKKRQRGEGVDEFSSLLPQKNSAGILVAPALLIGVGVLLLLNNLGLLEVRQVLRYVFPVLLIAVGALMLFNRVSANRNGGPEVRRD